MDFTTHTLVDGQYVTRTVDLDTVLRGYEQGMQIDSKFSEVDRSPIVGLLTQTVIRSPLVRWILPATLRDVSYNDVAFIGETFVQVKELRADGRLWDVLRKDDFGARIRNARVVGSMKTYSEDQNSQYADPRVKSEGEDCFMESLDDLSTQQAPSSHPPQCILLQLDSGDSVFLTIIKSPNGSYELTSSRHRVSKPMLGLQPGMHLAVDPSSRYMAIGCSEGVFAIYALNPREDLNRQYSEGRKPHYVCAERYLYFHGIILKMEFLHPSPDDEDHIILLILFVLKGKTRMKVYEWTTGAELRDISAPSHRSHLLEESRRMPLLLIPLTIKSSFILVSEKSMAVCQDILTGSPRFIDFNDRIDPPSTLFHGSGNPLWTAWARPVRLPEHAARRDDIYVTREDGVVKFLEIDSDEDEFIRADMNIGDFDCNCGTALASLDYHAYDDKTGDLLITGGDSCAGGTYLVKARHAPVFTASIPNWSPAQDFVIIPAVSTPQNLAGVPEFRRTKELVPKPDRVFACVGKGVKGAVVEFRTGLEANLALELETSEPVMQSWVLPPISRPPGHEDTTLFLSALGDCSCLLELADDSSFCNNVEQSGTTFDLSSRTITAATHAGWNIQVTEDSIVLVNDSYSLRRSAREFLTSSYLINHETESLQTPKIAYAAISTQFVVFTLRLENTAYLYVLELTAINTKGSDEATAFTSNPCYFLGKVESRHTCVALCFCENTLFAVVTEDTDDAISLTFRSVYAMVESYTEWIPKDLFIQDDFILEELVSIAVSYHIHSLPVLLCGTRNGLLVTLEISPCARSLKVSQCNRVGATPTFIHQDEQISSQKNFFLTCDSKLYYFTLLNWPDHDFSDKSTKKVYALNRIWFTDVQKPGLQQPNIHGVARLRPSISTSPDGGLLLVSDGQILLAEFSRQLRVVPRHIPIKGTPSRLMYSERLGALVVAACVEGRSSLIFIDPVSGADLSMPLDKNGEVVDYASGFGNYSERAFCVLEWSFNKNGNIWHFIVVSTNTGNVLLLSTDTKRISNDKRTSPGFEKTSENGHSPSGEVPGRNMIEYYTRHRFKCVEPVYSVAGFPDGLFYSSGDTLYCDILDVVLKKFKQVAKYRLHSPAFSLSFQDGKLFALTSSHSLEIYQIISNADGQVKDMERTHGDQVSRYSLHHVTAVAPSGLPLHLVSDKHCSIAGLWATEGTKADTLETVFEAQLPCSVTRFRSGRFRPIWDRAWTPQGRLIEANRGLIVDRGSDIALTNEHSDVHSATQPDILGFSIDGTIIHCKVVDHPTWRFLRFIIDRAMQSPTLGGCTDNSFDLEPATEPKTMMHIDGDLLKRVIGLRCLGELVGSGHKTAVEEDTFEKFRNLLNDLHGGLGHLIVEAKTDSYISLAYEDLEWFLRPVI